MNLPELIQSHGYWLLALGCLAEGETVLLLAGFAARRGHLDPAAVFAIASAAGFAGDQFFFWLGRRHGDAVLARWPSVAGQRERLQRLVDRYHGAVIVGVRFAYGLRIAGPILLGSSRLSAARFAAFNALGAMIWALAVGGAGWVFGAAAEALLGELRRFEGWLVAALLLASGVAWWIRRARR